MSARLPGALAMRTERDRMIWMEARIREAINMSREEMERFKEFYSKPYSDDESSRERAKRLELLDALWRRNRYLVPGERSRARAKAERDRRFAYKGVKQ